jgi:xylulose-5-phosphate/fructose-6-phosphate phosphoketolase
MLVRNDMDRYHRVMDVIDRVPGLALRAATLRQQMVDKLREHHGYIRRTGEDTPEVTNWVWPHAR